MKLTNSKQPTSEDTSFPGLFFTKSEGKQQVCYLKTSATSFYNNVYKNSLNSDAIFFVFLKILHSWQLRFLSQWASICVHRSKKSFLAKLSNETNFKMDSIFICTLLLVNHKAPFLWSTTWREIQLCDTVKERPSVNFLNFHGHIKAYFPTIRP